MRAVGKDGLRRYNKWAGNPNGTPEDTTCCITSVTPNERGGFAHSHQCNRKRGHGPEGLYCKQHDPAVVAIRQAAATERYQTKHNARMKPYTQRDAYRQALQLIADGHNDPCSVARKALET